MAQEEYKFLTESGGRGLNCHNMEGNKKSFCICKEKEDWKNVGLLLKGLGDLARQGNGI